MLAGVVSVVVVAMAGEEKVCEERLRLSDIMDVSLFFVRAVALG